MTLEDNLRQPEVHEKGWGRELWIANSRLYCGKILELNRGKQCIIHDHNIKFETFCILEGLVEMRLYYQGYPGEPTVLEMQEGDTIDIPRHLPHQFYGLEDSRILEISTQHFEEDSHRYVKGD